MNKGAPPLCVIAGPTASGKSGLAVTLAQRTNGVIVNADSAQVYADLRIVTARPSEKDMDGVEHLLFGYLDGGRPCSAAQWAADAQRAIDEVHASGRLPILVGGTGMYLRTLLDGIAEVPPIDPAIRAEVRGRSVGENHEQLAQLDPEVAAGLHPNDTTRVARALEVVRSTGASLKYWQRQTTGGLRDRVRLLGCVLLGNPAKLNRRIDARFEAMVSDGAIQEVEALLDRRLPESLPVMRAIGVPEIVRFLRGGTTCDTMIAQGQLATRQYAKRQRTWFRGQPLGIPADDDPELALRRLVADANDNSCSLTPTSILAR